MPRCKTLLLLVLFLAFALPLRAAERQGAIPTADSPSAGPATAPVTIVEFMDFTCPHCVTAAPEVRRLLHDFPQQVRLVMKYVPSDRRNATLAAEAALAAWEQGQYWKMHDKLIESFPRFGRKNLLQYAREIGLNMERFTSALDGAKNRNLIERDQALADSLGVFGTPTFFVNGRMVVGAPPYPAFKAMVEKELAQAGILQSERHAPAARHGALSAEEMGISPRAISGQQSVHTDASER